MYGIVGMIEDVVDNAGLRELEAAEARGELTIYECKYRDGDFYVLYY
jgi:hypothetical protein